MSVSGLRADEMFVKHLWGEHTQMSFYCFLFKLFCSVVCVCVRGKRNQQCSHHIFLKYIYTYIYICIHNCQLLISKGNDIVDSMSHNVERRQCCKLRDKLTTETLWGETVWLRVDVQANEWTQKVGRYYLSIKYLNQEMEPVTPRQLQSHPQQQLFFSSR